MKPTVADPVVRELLRRPVNQSRKPTTRKRDYSAIFQIDHKAIRRHFNASRFCGVQLAIGQSSGNNARVLVWIGKLLFIVGSI
jgi:hypothetical protein